MNEKHEFLMKVKDHFEYIAQLIKDYEMEDRILAASMIGILDPLDEDNSDLTAIYAMNIDSREELDVVTEFLVDADEENNPDLNDLLGGLGISLN